VKALLGVRPARAKVAAELDGLVDKGKLDRSAETERPLDPAGTALYRASDRGFEKMKLLALQEELVEGTSRLQFSIEGRLIRSLARVDRLDAIEGKGAQRTEIRAHIGRIAEGLRAGVQIPNPVLLVLLDSTTVMVETGEDEGIPDSFTTIKPLEPFTEVESPGGFGHTAQRTRLVEITFPFRFAAFDPEKTALLVDGQQRTAALAQVSLEAVPSIGLTVNAIVSDEEGAQDAFSVANDTVKIAADLSLMLAAIRKHVPAGKSEDKIKAEASRIMAVQDKTSPFYGIAKVPGAPTKGRYIVFLSLFEVVGLFRSQVLPATKDPKELATIVSRSFVIVRDLWPDAWSKPPGQSKLTHGAGLRAMGALMAKLAGAQKTAIGAESLKDDATWNRFKERVAVLQDALAWTQAEAVGATALAQKNYVEHVAPAQNTAQDIKALTEFIATLWEQLDE
jgi:DGQHR domain-containing protein